MRGSLQIIEGHRKGMVLYLRDNKKRTVIGRDRKCDIQLEDSGISRNHFCIVRQEGKFFLQDLGSSNGTYINGRQSLWQEVNEGDTISCGSTHLQFIFNDETKEFSHDSLNLKNFLAQNQNQTQSIKKLTRQVLMQRSLEDTGRIGINGEPAEDERAQNIPDIEYNHLDIICQKNRQEPAFSDYADVTKLSKTLSTLYKALELLNSQLELEQLLNVLVETALDITNAERGCLILKKSENAVPETVIFRTNPSTTSSKIPISKTVVNLALDQGIATVSSDAMSDKNLCNDSSSIILNNIRSVMCVPLEAKERILGAIYVDNLFKRNFFDDTDLDLLRAIGRQAGLAVSRTLLQEKISKSESKYRTIFEKAPFCMALVSPFGRLLDLNPAGYESLGLEDTEHCSILDIFPQAKNQLQNLLQKGLPFIIKEFHTENKKGKNMIFHLKGIPLVSEKGNFEGGMIIAEDITEAKRLQSQIIHQDKMATIGMLGAGVAHEFNNIIAGMMGYAQLLLKKKEKSPEHGLAEVVVEQCKRAREVVDRLLNFSRRKDDAPRVPVQLENLLEDVFQLLSRELAKKSIHIVRNFGEKVPPVPAQSGQVQQVFLNLVINAVQAMKSEGTLIITTEYDSEYVRVVFQDTGIGIPAKLLPSIFEPFFTTKKNHGTGLGLAVSYSIIQEYGGEITVESEINKGSTFTIHFPLSGKSLRT